MLPERKKKQVVPDFTGMKEETARIVAGRAGFENIVIRFVDSYEPEQTVVSQFPEKGILADVSREIKFLVSRRSLLRFLPAVYQQAPLNEKFFMRDFLWIIQHILDSSTARIDTLHGIFNPLLTEEEFLPWLAGWLGFAFEPDMPP
ncbi:MAG: PASTA domain-containing protein, partial [Deltaproteobacteria bacterium]|nr:PASTA domain-containing protein [Deltaproteobacteria bacterium]